MFNIVPDLEIYSLIPCPSASVFLQYLYVRYIYYVLAEWLVFYSNL